MSKHGKLETIRGYLMSKYTGIQISCKNRGWSTRNTAKEEKETPVITCVKLIKRRRLNYQTIT